LRVIVHNNTEKIFEQVFTQYPISFGRSKTLQVPLEFSFMSRVHCSISEENGEWYVLDLKSSNGIRVDSQKVERHDFKNDFAFEIASLRITVEVLPSTGLELHEKSVDTVATLLTEKKLDFNKAFDASKLLQTERLSEEKPISVPQSPKLNAPMTRPKSIQLEPRINSASMSVGGRGVVPLVGIQNNHKPIIPPEDPSILTGMFAPVSTRDFLPDLTEYHSGLSQARVRSVEAVIIWHDLVYDVKEFDVGETIIVGPATQSNLPLPLLREPWPLARVANDFIQFTIPQGINVSLNRGHEAIAMGDLVSTGQLRATGFGNTLRAANHEIVHVDFGHGLKVHLRFVPASTPLVAKRISDAETAVKQAVVTSGILHAALVAMLIFANPPQLPAPKLKNVPERFARLLVEKPKPTPTPKPEKPKPTPPPKKEIAKKKPEPKKIVKKVEPKPKPILIPEPKKVVVKVPQKQIPLPKVMANTNKYPIKVNKPPPPEPPPVKVESLGALAALGAISNAPQVRVPANININQNAGGPTKVNTSNFAGTLPSTHGNIPTGGGSVKTKGFGVGSGEGYGVQGLKGKAGARSVAGVVVGEPKLAQNAKYEGLTRAQVLAVVNKYLTEVQHCYERSLLMDPNLAGRMEFEWDISSSGSVSSVRVKRSTVNQGDALAECVKGVFTSMKFPSAKNGQTTTPVIGFPFGRL